MIELIDATKSPTATWCRRSSTGCSPCPRTCGADTTCAACARWSMPQRPARPNQAGDDRLVGRVIYEYYAATEGGGTVITADEWLEKPGSVGMAWTGREIRILDDDHKSCPPAPMARSTCARPGRLRVLQGPRQDQGNRRAGFFTVGDLGTCDDGRLPVPSDRKSDMIISGGVNIYPAEIEGVMIGAPGWTTSPCSESPTRTGARRSKPSCEPAPGVEPDDALRESIYAYLADRLGKFKQPKSIDFIEDHAAGPLRQALQTKAARSLLGRPRPGHLARQPLAIVPRSVRVDLLLVGGDQHAGGSFELGVRPTRSLSGRWPTPPASSTRRGRWPPRMSARVWVEVGQDLIAHRSDLLLHVGPAGGHAGVGRRASARTSALLNLGWRCIAWHARLSMSASWSDPGVAARRRLRHPVAEPGGPLGHGRGRADRPSTRSTGRSSPGPRWP